MRLVGFTLFCLFLACFTLVKAQDVHFSQYFDFPTFVNPASAGIHNGRIRISGAFKDQWRSIPAPFTTTALSIDAKVLEGNIGGRGDRLGVGGIIYYDMAGKSSLGLQTSEIRLVGAYNKALNNNTILSAGLSISYSFRAVKYTDAKAPNQWDGFRYNPDLPIGESFRNRSFGDLGAGVLIAGVPSDALEYMAGVAMYHPVRPNVSVVGKEDRLYIKWGGHGQLRYTISDRISIMPGTWFWIQGPYSEFLISLLAEYELGRSGGYGENVHRIGWGFGFRIGDAIYPVLRYSYGGLRVTLSYDITTSSLSSINRYRGGLEISAGYVIGMERRIGTHVTPRF